MPCFVVISISELAGAADARATYAHFDVEANLSNFGVSGLNVAKGLES